MGSRDHLIPSMTVDRNGHAKTVYVSPSGGSKASSLSGVVPTLSRFEEYDSEEESEFGPEWEDISDPDSWQSNDFSADDAQDWSYEGFDADDAYQWRAAGFNFSNAGVWRTAGMNENEAKEWSAGFDADEAITWSINGFAPDTASDWQASFDSAEKAGDWYSNGFDISQASEYFDAGFTDAGEASEWRDAMGNARVEVTDLFALHEAGAESGDGRQWLHLHNVVQNVPGGKDVSLSELLETMNGVNPSAGDSYADHFPYSKWEFLASNHIEFDMVQPLVTATSIINEMRQEDEGEYYEDDEDGDLSAAVSWIRGAESLNNSKAKVIHSLIREGKSPSQYSVFLANGNRIKYGNNVEDVDKAQSWASEAAGDNAAVEAKADKFGVFYTSLQEMGSGLEDLVKNHGAARVEEAMERGMKTEAQLHNYLEHIPVAAISEGAL